MDGFRFYMPTKIIFEEGVLEKTADFVREFGNKALLLTDKMMLETDIVKRVINSLNEGNIDYIIWDDIVPNPRDVDIEKGAEFARKNNIEYLIAVGGGSAIDTAKAIGAIMTNGGKCSDLYGDKLKKPIAPLIAVPTTCGTGSEVTHESIVNNTVTMVKDCIWGPYNSVSVALLDAAVLEKLPPHIMGSTGMDALTHAIEAYVGKASNPFTDALAIAAIEMIGKSLISGVKNKNKEDLENMLVASCMAGAAFGNSDVASVHSIAEALGGYYDIPHGVANAMMLPEVSRISVPGAPEKYADVAKALGVDIEGLTVEEAAYAGVEHIKKMTEILEIPSFGSLKCVDPKDFDRLAKTAAEAPETADNPVMMYQGDFKELFERLYAMG